MKANTAQLSLINIAIGHVTGQLLQKNWDCLTNERFHFSPRIAYFRRLDT